MEIVVFLAMMIVPFISIAALAISLVAKNRADNLKEFVIRKSKPRQAEELEMMEL